MTLLLDTHVFIWAALEPQKLSPSAYRAMRSRDNELVLSCVTLIEMALKIQTGKMLIPLNRDYLNEHLDALGITRILDITTSHALTLLTIPRLHGDPFDRLLVAQCATENMRFVTADRMFRKYPIEVLW
jgi:PIN domain nuclease of toxin-antitoxin system